LLVGPGGRGSWGETDSRRCLVEMGRRGVSVVSALSGGTDATTLPAFLQTRPHMRLGANVLESRLPAILAGFLAVTVPELSVAMIEAGPADEHEGQSFVEEKTGIRFLWVPGGTFMMGADDISDEERPPHQVQLSGYWLAQAPVTNRQYEIFLREQQGSREPRLWRQRKYNQPEQPVVGVSWLEAKEFCRWLSKMSGQKMELPTETQWERAARGADGRNYPWGDEEPDGTRAHHGKSLDDAPIPVGSLPAGRGPYGHLDLAGNVREWCRDVWDGRAYEKRGELTVDPEAPGEEDGEPGAARACRGGDFGSESRYLRSAYRDGSLADDWGRGLGFRVAALPASR
jgi:formylglycine-generating enzyme required for sulfatase activity